MLKHALQYANRQRFHMMILSVHMKNVRAQTLYAASGFQLADPANPDADELDMVFDFARKRT